MTVFLALAAAVLATSVQGMPSRALDAGRSRSCPPWTPGWILFEDSSRRVPDFWWQDSLAVQRISVCPDGITFLFLGKDAGTLYVAALVFLNPSGKSWDGRGIATQCGKSREFFETRYQALRDRLNQVSGGLFRSGGEVDFGRAAPEARPWILNPAGRLVLHWMNQEILLRGYLDVYLNLIS